MVNRFSGPGDTMDALMKRTYVPGVSDKVPPVNIWGNKLFLVKIQPTMSGSPTHMMLYDRKRSFQVFFVREDDTVNFAAFLEEVRGPRAEMKGLKMYRWARRTGDWEFSVCLDRAPAVDTKW